MMLGFSAASESGLRNVVRMPARRMEAFMVTRHMWAVRFAVQNGFRCANDAAGTARHGANFASMAFANAGSVALTRVTVLSLR
jgi:hypothetical protein